MASGRIVEVIGHEPPGHRWRPAAAIAVLVAVTATVGVLIAVLQRPPSHASIRPTAIPTSIPAPTPTAIQAPPDLSGAWTGLCTGPLNGFFSLTLTQTANALDGTMTLSSPILNLHISGISGNLTGSTISFETVGVVTYTGTLSGSTISGSLTDIENGKAGSCAASLSP